MSECLPAVVIEPASAAQATVIWLHGLGADGHDFEPIVPMLGVLPNLAVRFVLPHAPSLPVTVNNGAVMPAWYDILRFGEEREYNHAQLLQSVHAVHSLIEQELALGIPSHKIVLAGFSQGGAVCYHAALSFHGRLAGVLGLSTYFPSAEQVSVHPQQHGLQVMICHGTYDPIVPISMGRTSRRALEDKGLHPEFRTYVMAHEVCAEEINDIGSFINRSLS